MAEVKPEIETFAKIKVIGVGGSGNSTVNRMVKSKIRGVDFISINTDVQALHHSLAPKKIHIGKTATRGLGAGMDPEVGRTAAEENQNEIRDSLLGSDMVFITCGLGGGTGTGAAPVVARIARELGALTVAVVTKPFLFEGAKRRSVADTGHEQLIEHVDTVVTIPNDRVLQIIEKKTSLLDAFQIVDDILRQAVQGISELITIPGLINVDFADVRAILSNAGSALMGIGTAKGEERAAQAAKAAISSPLLELSIEGARGILFTITGNAGLGMMEVSEAAKIITSQADPDAKIIFGANIDDTMDDSIKITVVATGFDDTGKRAMTKVIREPFPRVVPSAAAISNRPAVIPAAPSGAPAKEKESVPVTTGSTNLREERFAVTPSVRDLSAAPLGQVSVSVSEPVPPPPKIKATPSPVVVEEDLEIPAFLRKKML